MANYKVTDSELTGIADVIRLKGGTSDPLVFPSGFASAVAAIETRGTYVSKTITSNGEYDPASDNADAFSHVTVSVPTGSSPVLVSKNISQNGTYNPVDDNADAYSQVVVNVSGGGGLPEWIFTGESGSLVNSTISQLRCGAFYSHSGLTYISLPNCTKIEKLCFYYAENLSQVFFPMCNSIGENAFYACKKLEDLSFPNCNYISNSVFMNCTSASIAWFPVCSYIGNSAFMNCSRIRSFYFLSNAIATLSNRYAFSNTGLFNSTYFGSFASVFVPESLVNAYKTASQWSYISDRITSYVEE